MAKHTIGEEWRPVVGYEGHYEVSSLGRVKTVKKVTNKRNGPIMRTNPNRGGYLAVCLQKHGKGKVLRVHTMVLEAFVGKRPTGQFQTCNHKNGIKTDNRVENLEWTTQAKNNLHRYRTLGHKAPRYFGDDNKNSRLTSMDVAEIRRRRGLGETVRTIAIDFGISSAHCYDIINERVWKPLRVAVEMAERSK